VTITAAPPAGSGGSRDRRADARVVGDGQGVVLRHVQVGADEDALAAQVEVGESLKFIAHEECVGTGPILSARATARMCDPTARRQDRADCAK
jgi:hypothetical protein